MNLNEMAQQGAPEADPTTGTTGGKQQPTAQQQAQFGMLLGRARQIMGEQAQEWRQAMEADPVEAAVRMGTQTLRFLAMDSEKAGQPVDPAVLLHAGVQLVKDIAGVANDAGLVPDDQLEPFLQQVMQESIAEYMRMDADEGLMPSPEQLQQKGGQQPPPAPGPRGMNLAQMAQGGMQ
ncbi:hypothetical protein PMI14_05316 [Acidovorax sp. CF316]|uniref:hypothetical protein n=1 Tax=Acidovorax sp. CF316 TaxID=1144317 RepID=UPI00026BD029|nr:hypothetical protein [Acidovorax sp. CF316]EJE50111.1 hypothetical protein PMI14_05316 [Acidovorax sp. CF316]